ncbi:MAG: hypothetical protein ACREFE_13105 [Limisphaerales bacterium]
MIVTLAFGSHAPVAVAQLWIVRQHRAFWFMEAQPAIRRSLLKELIALLIFLFVCGSLALPLLCVGGDVAGRYKTAFVFLVFCRMAWRIYKHTFCWRDYFIYFALAAGLCIWIDSYL